MNDNRIWSIKKPATIPSHLPAGCKNNIPHYDKADGLGHNPSIKDVEEATRQWYELAENEFVDIMGLDHEKAAA